MLAELQRFDEAVKSYRESLAVKADNEYAWLNLGITLKSIGKNDEAKKALGEAKKLNPGNPEVDKALKGL